MPASVQRLVQAADAVAHALRLGRADAQPQHVHLLRERRRIGEHAVEVGLRVELAIARACRRRR